MANGMSQPKRMQACKRSRVPAIRPPTEMANRAVRFCVDARVVISIMKVLFIPGPGFLDHEPAGLVPWSPTFAPDHPSDEDLSLGAPVSREDGARCIFVWRDVS